MAAAPPPPYLYKILTLEEWADFQKCGTFTGSTLDKKDGFIHTSTLEQRDTTRRKFFAGVEVVVVEMDTAKIKDPIKLEAKQPGATSYYHIYGTMPLHAVVSSTKLT